MTFLLVGRTRPTPLNGSRTRMVSSRSGLVESKATGMPVSSSTRRIYFTAFAGNSAQNARHRWSLTSPAFLHKSASIFLISGIGGEIIQPFAATIIADTDIQHIKPIQHIQLGQRHAGNARGQARLAHHYRIKPATAPLAPGDSANSRPRSPIRSPSAPKCSVETARNPPV